MHNAAFAALGLLINERSGVVNLGAEGMMLMAAIAGFAVTVGTGSDWLGLLAGGCAGALLSAVLSLAERRLSPSRRVAAAVVALLLVGAVSSPLLLASDLGVDLAEALEQKLVKDAEKYPIEKSRGRAEKYTDL